MSFEDELRGVIQKARDERQQYETAGDAFESEWLKYRGSFILEIFKEAERAFEAEEIRAEAKLTNGSIVLGVERDGQNYRHTLKFSPDKETRMVISSSTIPDHEKESFTLEHLTRHAVSEKVKQFAYEIVKGNVPRPFFAA